MSVLEMSHGMLSWKIREYFDKLQITEPRDIEDILLLEDSNGPSKKERQLFIRWDTIIKSRKYKTICDEQFIDIYTETLAGKKKSEFIVLLIGKSHGTYDWRFVRYEYSTFIKRLSTTKDPEIKDLNNEVNSKLLLHCMNMITIMRPEGRLKQNEVLYINSMLIDPNNTTLPNPGIQILTWQKFLGKIPTRMLNDLPSYKPSHNPDKKFLVFMMDDEMGNLMLYDYIDTQPKK